MKCTIIGACREKGDNRKLPKYTVAVYDNLVIYAIKEEPIQNGIGKEAIEVKCNWCDKKQVLNKEINSTEDLKYLIDKKANIYLNDKRRIEHIILDKESNA